MSTPVYFLVLIELNAGMADQLRRYEQQAVPVMRRHGGQLVYVFRPVAGTASTVPDEVHLLAFESEAGFVAFRNDPELHAVRQLRDAAVKQAIVLPLHSISLESYLTPPGA